jgi:hypothetical protein
MSSSERSPQAKSSRFRRWRELVTAAGVVIAAVGALLRGSGVSGWPATVCLAGGVMVAVLGLVLLVAHQRAEVGTERLAEEARRRNEEMELRRALRVPVTRLLEVDSKKIGVRQEVPIVLLQTGAEHELQYLPRPCDSRLAEMLSAAVERTAPPLVCVVGPSRSGKSRTLFHALANGELASAWLVAPRDRKAVQTVLAARLLDRDDREPVVLWLDDLERYARDAEFGFDAALLRELAHSPTPVVVAATRGGIGLEVEHPHLGDLRVALAELTAPEECQSVDLDRTLSTTGEAAHLHQLTSTARRSLAVRRDSCARRGRPDDGDSPHPSSRAGCS